MQGLNTYSQYVFRHLDIVDGLSDNQIRNFTMTSDGRLSIRTVSILNLYNGATFEHFYHDRRKDYKWRFNRYQIFKEYHDIDGRIWMKAPGYLSLFDLKTNRFNYDIDLELRSLGIEQKLKNLFIDESKNYWFLTEDNTFSFYDITQKELKIIDEGNSAFTQQYGIPYELAQYKNLYWIVYSSGLLRCWDSTSQEFITQDTYFYGKISTLTDRLSIRPTATGDLWLMYNNAVSFYNRTDKRWKEAASIKGASNFFTCMDLDKDGNVWVGASWSGLRKIDAQTHEVTTLSSLKLNNGGTLNNDIQCVFVDQDNGLWVGTLWNGICYYHPSMHKFKLVQTVHNETLFSNESVRCLLEDNDGSILIGATDGLMRYDPATEKITKAFDNIPSSDLYLCLSLYRDKKKRLWIGTYLNGFYCIDGKNVKTYNKLSENLELYPNQNLSRAIFEDANGRFWVSVRNEGIGELDLSTGQITLLRDKHPEIAFHKVDFNFYPVDDQTFAVFGESGIYYYDIQKDKTFIPEIDDPDNPKFLGPNVKYYCIFKDSHSLEWFGTEQGIRIWDERQKKVYTIDIEDGLPNNSISAIIEDDNGIYWVSSLNGITKIEIKENAGEYTFSLVNFDVHDGLQSGKFYDRSSLKTSTGALYFGGHHGINTFDPDKLQYNHSINKPIFTAFKLFNSLIKENTAYDGHVILKNPVNNTRKIKLNYKENFITLEFSGVNYVNPSRTYFRYKLNNFDQNWTEIDAHELGSVTYTGLRPGTYTFTVYTANNDKVWGDEAAEMTIIITPPFWATVYAYILYILLLLGGIFCLFVYISKRNRTKQIERQAIERQKQKEELDQMKFRFFTNISHEFRTPLTLIMTPLSTLINQQQEGQLKQKLEAIHRNADNMLSLINQLLDFRKLEMGGEKLKLAADDLVKFVSYIHATFRDSVINRAIDFKFESECKQLNIRFDKSKIQKVMSNLYSNALKFTPDGGQILTQLTLTQEDNREYIKIEIADTGCGIEEKEIDSIFDRFYQSDRNDSGVAGSGIGLHLVKEYVELHEGKITVHSKLNEGSIFSVCIPLDLKGKDIPAINDNAFKLEEEPEKENVGKTLLVVEDNVEFRNFLVEQLSDGYTVLQAGDGEEGENIAIQKSPDLIISDLMMPKVDGLEMCHRIKNNIQTSHIPIILLTARLSDEAKIESYKAGADSYISKPFNFDVLSARIEMLIEQQEKRKELFHKTIEITPSSITITSLDEEFIKKTLQFVEKNINNTEYSVDQLSMDLGLSRSNLYRKFQSITGLSPNDFIRSIRLKRAAQLLKASQYNISEISDIVGFNSIKYFNKYFKEEFGVTPTQYRAENIS
jgi:signal transduction histidine kinase/DNA-binding response OmpR family regulator/ligand-binding sensor domain-containing protein